MVTEHTHAVNAAVTGLSALPGVAQPFASTLAMGRFLNNDAITLPALIEPLQEKIRDAVADSTADVVLYAHDWCMFNYAKHTGKTDRLQRTHATDLGYELGSALLIEAADGRPLGPMELRLRTAHGWLTTRPGDPVMPRCHLDELADVFRDARRWQLALPIVHLIDREADSVGHYRDWHRAGHRFVVRADSERRVTWNDQEVKLPAVVAGLAGQFRPVLERLGKPLCLTTRKGEGTVRVAEATVILHRPAKTMIDGKKTDVPGPPLPLRLVVSQVVDEDGQVLAEWLLLTNVEAVFDATTIAQWYAWRWRIESYHKLLKTAGHNAEEWQQESGLAIAKRLVIATMACLTVWLLHRDESVEAVALKKVLIRLSGRQMKWKVAATAPALLAGLEKLLALHDLLTTMDLTEVLALAHRVLPTLFPQPPPKHPGEKL